MPHVTERHSSAAEAGDGDAARLTSAPSPKRVPGIPFERGNRAARKREQELTEAEFLAAARQALSKAAVRRMVRRLGRIADQGTGKDALQATKFLLMIGAPGVLAESTPGVRRQPQLETAAAPPRSALIDVPDLDEMVPPWLRRHES